MDLSRKRFVAAAGLLAFTPAAARADEAVIVDHAVIFRFPMERVELAKSAFKEMEALTRKQSGNLQYTVYRSKDDEQTFVIFERWVSQAALDAHQETDAFVRLGRGTLERYATTHDAVTCVPLD